MGILYCKIFICNRCGAEVRCKKNFIGEYEDPPEGWDNNRYVAWLCPECSRKFDQLVDNFMKGSDND